MQRVECASIRAENPTTLTVLGALDLKTHLFNVGSS